MDYEKAAVYWIDKEAHAVGMENDAILAEMEKFIQAHNTCTLATGCGDFVRCTPIEYNYKDRKFWLFSEGGLKFYALAKNKNVCLAIYDGFSGFDRLGGMQITGTAEIVAPWSAEYLDLLAFKKLSTENVKKLPQAIYLIKITPARIDFLWSGFKKLGFDIRQHLCLSGSALSMPPCPKS